MSTQGGGLSVIVITLNEEKNIADCLRSVAWAEEIVVVDAESSDRTAELARQFTQKAFVQKWAGFAGAKEFALRQATRPWVLWLDADERVPEQLAAEIRSVVSGPAAGLGGYEVARRAYFLGKWIRHSGWYPGYVVRLFRREGAQFPARRVHEKLRIGGETGRLGNDLLHFTDETLYHYFSKFNSYTSLAAEDAVEGGKGFSWYDILLRPPFMFFKMYLLRRGFLDGMHGFVLSLLSASYVFVKYAKIWELTARHGAKHDAVS